MVVAAVGAAQVHEDCTLRTGSRSREAVAYGTVLFILFWLAYSPVPRPDHRQRDLRERSAQRD